MRTTKILTISLMAITSLSSCELKDELSSKTPASETGMLELAVSVQQPSDNTKAATDDVNTFPVTVVNTESEEVAYSCEAYSEMESTITLPVGTYTVTAHTPGEIKTRMTAAYYSGSEQLVISDGITSQANVECKPQNLRLRMNYSDYFKSTFTSWTITFNDGNDNTLTFTNDSEITLYWYIGENVTTITMDVTATTTDGTTIHYQNQLTKADAENPYTNDNPNFTGGDGLDINFGVEDDPVEEDKPQIVIDVTLDITFGDSNETVEIPVEDEPTTPGTGDDDEEEEDEPQIPGTGTPEIQMPADITYSISENNAPAKADAVITTPAGLKSLIVTIQAGNSGFEEIMNGLTIGNETFATGVDMVDNNDVNTLFSSIGMSEITSPASGTKEYTFPIGSFFTFLNITGATDAGKAHTFIIKVTDQNNQTVTDELKITINE